MRKTAVKSEQSLKILSLASLFNDDNSDAFV